jgi:hypothetical protein
MASGSPLASDGLIAMATLVLGALGTVVGGPLGGAIGSLIGSQVDRSIIGGSQREGPRLKELGVSTSSYGTPIPRHFGTMRAPGTVIWATDLVESSEHSGGGKGKPSVTRYSYSASFAVALSSRPIQRLARVWADGSLLRGQAGDLKVGGELRVYAGHGDQLPDPLIASDKGGACPAFRGLAYCMFDTLQLADFGNRVPTLTFEIVADDGQITLANLVEPIREGLSVERPLQGLAGFSDEGGALAATLAMIDQLYPLACDAGGDVLTIEGGDAAPAEAPVLPEPAVDAREERFGEAWGRTRRRHADATDVPASLRYYDTGRDYQAGVQRADGRARPGRTRTIEFPGALDAVSARALANAAAERAGSSRETLSWRIAELDPAVAPGQVVRVRAHPGRWRIDAWEWREAGIELELRRLPRGCARMSAADAGDALSARDLEATPTRLLAFELPWDGQGAGDVRQPFVAASSASAGWTGAALYLVDGSGNLVPSGTSGRRRSVIGELATALAPSAAMLLEREGTLLVDLISADFQLQEADIGALAQGANRALVGGEVLQFAQATRVGGARWRLKGLLRGRGGGEAAAQIGHAAGTPFVLLDDPPVALDPRGLASGESSIAAIGLADSEPVIAPLINSGMTRQPLPPVHPLCQRTADGGLSLSWKRRARGAWLWPDGVDVPLGEQAERYQVGLGDTDAPVLAWELSEPRIELSAASVADLAATYPGQPLWVRQLGSFAPSIPLQIALLA